MAPGRLNVFFRDTLIKTRLKGRLLHSLFLRDVS